MFQNKGLLADPASSSPVAQSSPLDLSASRDCTSTNKEFGRLEGMRTRTPRSGRLDEPGQGRCFSDRGKSLVQEEQDRWTRFQVEVSTAKASPNNVDPPGGAERSTSELLLEKLQAAHTPAALGDLLARGSRDLQEQW
jgi:hypothetical protein